MRPVRPLGVLLLVVLLLPTAPLAEAGHPPAPQTVAVLTQWRTAALAEVGAVTVPPSDRGFVEALADQANRSVARGSLTAAGSDLARYGAYAAFAAANARMPADDGTQPSRDAQRLWWLNETAARIASADANVSAARAELKAFQPKTAEGAEWGILAGRLLVGAHLSLLQDYATARQAVVGMNNPDTSTGVYRQAILKLYTTTAGPELLTLYARDVLAVAKERDAAGGARLSPERWAEVVAYYRAGTEQPSTTSPTQTEYAYHARDALRADQVLFGIASFILFDELRTAHGYEFQQQTGALTPQGLVRARDQALARAESALNGTASSGLPALLLRDAAAFAFANDALAGAARLQAGHAVHDRVAYAAGVGGDSAATNGTTYVLAAAGGVLAVLAGWLYFRRR